jgi:hypothetical protein
MLYLTLQLFCGQEFTKSDIDKFASLDDSILSTVSHFERPSKSLLILCYPLLLFYLLTTTLLFIFQPPSLIHPQLLTPKHLLLTLKPRESAVLESILKLKLQISILSSHQQGLENLLRRRSFNFHSISYQYHIMSGSFSFLLFITTTFCCNI